MALSPFPQLANNIGRLNSTPSNKRKKFFLIMLVVFDVNTINILICTHYLTGDFFPLSIMAYGLNMLPKVYHFPSFPLMTFRFFTVIGERWGRRNRL